MLAASNGFWRTWHTLSREATSSVSPHATSPERDARIVALFLRSATTESQVTTCAPPRTHKTLLHSSNPERDVAHRFAECSTFRSHPTREVGLSHHLEARARTWHALFRRLKARRIAGTATPFADPMGCAGGASDSLARATDSFAGAIDSFGRTTDFSRRYTHSPRREARSVAAKGHVAALTAVSRTAQSTFAD